MKATIFKMLLVITLFSGIATSGIARTMNRQDIPLQGDKHDDQKRSVTQPIPIVASINAYELTIDFLASLGDVTVTVSSESGSVLSINYSILAAQTAILTLDGITSDEECQIEIVTSDGMHYWGNFVTG